MEYSEKWIIRKIVIETISSGPVRRTVAPFDRCDRERDYETAWMFFEKKWEKLKNKKVLKDN